MKNKCLEKFNKKFPVFCDKIKSRVYTLHMNVIDINKGTIEIPTFKK